MLLKRCDRIIVEGKVKKLDTKTRNDILKANSEFAKDALRVLGFAYKEAEKKSKDYEDKMVFVGLQGMIDPPRAEVKDAIVRCKSASIKVVMITGDYIDTAVAIAKELGIEGKAVQGEDLRKMDLDKEVEQIGIYARVNPEDKMKIVEALKKKDFVVAMTGDGVNDAPALKKADMGIAMGITGTDVAKEASDMILTDDNFASIVNAVEEGRGVYDNVQKSILYLLSSNIGEVFIVFFAMLFDSMLNISLPFIKPFQLLWINLVTDGLPATALSVDPTDHDIMTRKPRRLKSGVLNRFNMGFMISIGIIMMVGVLGVYYYYRTILMHEHIYAISVAFTTLMMFQMFNLFNCRSLTKSAFKVGVNWKLVGAVALSILLHILLLAFATVFPTFGEKINVVAISLFDWVIVTLVASSVLVVWEVLKVFGVKATSE
jgi:Ca2+-transporting ATPase